MNGRRVLAVARRHYYVTLNSPHRSFEVLFWPMLDLMLWGLLSRFLHESANVPAPLGFLVGGVLLWDLLFRSKLGIATAFLEESWARHVVPILASPVTPAEYLAGAALVGLAKLAVGWTVMAVVGWGLFQFSVLSLGPSLVVLAGAVMLFGLALSLVVVALVMRFGQGTEIMAWALAAMLMPLAAVFYPVSVLPGWAQAVAYALPPAHAFEAMRAVLDGSPLPMGHMAAAYALSLGWLVGGWAVARASFRTLRRRGFVTRWT